MIYELTVLDVFIFIFKVAFVLFLKSDFSFMASYFWQYENNKYTHFLQAFETCTSILNGSSLS